MRLSVDRHDRGFSKWAYKAEPYLNGKYIDRVITADEDEGFLIRYKTDKDGSVLVNHERNEIIREILYGDVMINFHYENQA